MSEPTSGRGTTKRKQSRGAGAEDSLALALDAMKRHDAFEAERLAARAIREAHAKRDYAALAKALPTLREARLSVRDEALRAKKIYRTDTITDETAPEPGLWLIEPPAVGADGRNLRDRSRAQRVPLVVLVREPETRSGHWPVVMVGPATVRARVQPLQGKPTPTWIMGAIEALGAAAVDSVDASAPETRVNQLVDRLEALPECDAVYDALAQACAVAAEAQRDAESRRRTKPAESHAPADDSDDDDDSDNDDEDDAR